MKASEVAHLRGCAQHGHDARGRSEKVLLISSAVRSVGGSRPGGQVRRPAGTPTGIGVSLGKHRAGQEVAVPAKALLGMKRAVIVEGVDGDDVGDSGAKKGDAGKAEAIQKQTSDRGSAFTTRQPKRE